MATKLPISILFSARAVALRKPFCNALTRTTRTVHDPARGRRSNLLCKPATILYNKVTIKDARQAVPDVRSRSVCRG